MIIMTYIHSDVKLHTGSNVVEKHFCFQLATIYHSGLTLARTLSVAPHDIDSVVYYFAKWELTLKSSYIVYFPCYV
jgi:hypothetical protein